MFHEWYVIWGRLTLLYVVHPWRFWNYFWWWSLWCNLATELTFWQLTSDAANVNCHLLQPVENGMSELHFQLLNVTVDMIGSNPHLRYIFVQLTINTIPNKRHCLHGDCIVLEQHNVCVFSLPLWCQQDRYSIPRHDNYLYQPGATVS